MSDVERIKKKGGVKRFFITVVVILMLFVNEDMLIFATCHLFGNRDSFSLA